VTIEDRPIADAAELPGEAVELRDRVLFLIGRKSEDKTPETAR